MGNKNENAASVPSNNPLGSAPVASLIRKFAIPSIISMLVAAAYNITDQIFIGQVVGMLGNAATNVAFPTVTLTTALAQLIGVGTAANFNLNMGAKKPEEASRFVGTGITLLSICGPMLALVMLLQTRICAGGRTSRGFIAFGGLACLCSVAVFLALPVAGYALLAGYSYLIDAFRWVTAAYITFAAVRAALKSAAYSRVLLSGTLIFDCALVMDRLLPLHEPIVTGWFPELAGFALVMCVGAAAAGELAAQVLDNAVLRERAAGVETLMRAQRAYYPLLDERIGATKKGRARP